VICCGSGDKYRMSVRTKFRSKFEQTFAEYLTKKGHKFEYETRKTKFRKPVQGGLCEDCSSTRVSKRATYLCDFLVGKSPIYVETKGRFVSSDRTKILAMLSTSPDINRSNFRLLFMRDNFTTKSGKERYTDWCKRNGVQCAVWPKIPRGFLK
jgi:hypothetical protein